LFARPLTEDEFAAWREHALEGYVAGMVGGGMRAEEARDQAEQDFSQLLAGGVETPGHRILVLEDEASGERRGVLWFAEQERSGRRTVYLYDIEIDEPHRGRGLGRAAMLLFERLALEAGAEEAGLAVFGGNTTALRLYASLDYRVVVRVMRKDLRPPRRA
jgi:ribosomal protein S18 acetylase RimI-like enzyme